MYRLQERRGLEPRHYWLFPFSSSCGKLYSGPFRTAIAISSLETEFVKPRENNGQNDCRLIPLDTSVETSTDTNVETDIRTTGKGTCNGADNDACNGAFYECLDNTSFPSASRYIIHFKCPGLALFGGADGIRTRDFLRDRQAC